MLLLLVNQLDEGSLLLDLVLLLLVVVCDGVRVERQLHVVGGVEQADGLGGKQQATDGYCFHFR